VTNPAPADVAADAPIRAAVVDVGSNSVRLVVYDGPARIPDVFANEKTLCGLGRDLARTGRLAPDGVTRAKAALTRFAAMTAALGIDRVDVVATAAVREAEDGPAFVETVAGATGWSARVLSGEEEARLAALGVAFGIPDACGWVVDMGGASVEVAALDRGHVGARVSLPVGPLTLGDLPVSEGQREAYLRGLLDAALARTNGEHEMAYLVGGSARAIARVDMLRRGYPLPVLHGYEITADDFERTRAMIRKTPPAQLRAATGIGAGRVALLREASELLGALLRRLDVRRSVVSSFGLREGTVFDRMPPAVREADPLLVAARTVERRHARFPGRAAALDQFVEPLLLGADGDRRRWVRAACHLHDVHWRVHPDYRHEVAFDEAMRATLCGVTHVGRVYIALVLSHRYKKRPGAQHGELAAALLPPAQRTEAAALGRAMRLWTALGSPDGPTVPTLVVGQGGAGVTLRLPAPDPRWRGEVVENRLRALARVLGTQARVELAPTAS